MLPLFSAQELADFIQRPVSDAAGAAAERVVWGWLSPLLGLTQRPMEVPAQVFSWAIELGAIAYENPSGLSQYHLGAERLYFSAERRDEILREVGDSSQSSAGAPRGSFPPAQCWPDPPRRPFYYI